MPQKFLDMFGNPINVGDTIVYPATAGSSVAQMRTAVVTEVVPIVPQDPSDPDCRRGRTQTGTALDKKSRPLFERPVPDQEPEIVPYTHRAGTYKRYKFEYDPDRLYLLRVKRVQRGSDDFQRDSRPGITIKNIDRVVVVTSLLEDA